MSALAFSIRGSIAAPFSGHYRAISTRRCIAVRAGDVRHWRRNEVVAVVPVL